MKRLTDWYAHPRYYEAIFGTDTEREMDFLEGLHRRYGNGGRRWLEPACGAGRLLAEGAKRGLTLVGYDLSERMLAYARKRMRPASSARVSLHQARMEAFCPPQLVGRMDLAFNLVSTFRYLDSEAAALSHLRATARLLSRGGIYVLGFHLTDYARRTPERERWVGHAGGARVVCNTREGAPDRASRSSAMRNRLRVTGPRVDLLIETEWSFRTYSGAQARSLFRRAGLKVLARHDFDYTLDAQAAGDRLDSVFVLAHDPSPSGRATG
ncbi:MAG: class I SAM-dependent methyltransferase [Myxococcaceae bacterium]|nr:class I SAM-dependent methyltransferase [Myxococcaceae bacterium]